MPILKAEASLLLPAPGIIQTACYDGPVGSPHRCRDEKVDEQRAEFSTERIQPQQGMTIATGFQKGIVPILTPTRPKSFVEQLVEPLPLLTLVMMVLLGSGFIMRKWWKQGRDYWGGNMALVEHGSEGRILPLFTHETISVEFTPPDGIKPAEMGVILDEKADTHDVTATIVDLASRGYLTIEEVKKKWILGKSDYILHRLAPKKSALVPFEQELLDRLFGSKDEVTLSSLKLTFSDDLKKVKDMLYHNVTAKQLFLGNPEKIRQKYLVIGIFLTVLPFIIILWAGLLLSSAIIFMIALGITISGLTLLIFSQQMPRKTAYGRSLYRRSLGYRQFISGAEKYRQQFYERQNLFTEVLPYAIVFGLTEKFAKAMKDIGVEQMQPSWYTGYTAFNATTFVSSMSDFSKTLSTSMAATPSSSGSSGGGFSGGGFGGGGGGSW